MMTRINGVDLDDFTHHYLVTAMWASHVMLPGEVVDGCMDVADDHPLHGISEMDNVDDHFCIDDFTVEALRKACEDCDYFQEANAIDLADEDSETAGHDFWLTRNGHGAGYCDGDYEEEKSQRLTESSKESGELHIYVNDDGSLDFE